MKTHAPASYLPSMLPLSSILSQGYKDWTPGQWGMAVGYVLGAIGTFLLMTFGPWLLKMSREMRESRREVSEAKTQAAVAESKADHANQGVVNANNRIVSVAAMTTPPTTPAPPPPKPPMQALT